MNAEQIAAIATLVGSTMPSPPVMSRALEGVDEPEEHPALDAVVIVRCRKAGVHIGTLSAYTGDFVTLEDSVRLWRWEGAFTLSGVAVEGPRKCRLGAAITVHLEREDVCEIIPISAARFEQIKSVAIDE